MRAIANKKIAAVAAGAIVVASAGAAYAYWTTSGSGTGSGSTQSGAANLVQTGSTAPTTMAPGVAAGAITATVRNDGVKALVSSATVSLNKVTNAAGVELPSSGAGACTIADYTLSGAAMTAGAAELATGTSTTFSGATLGFHNIVDKNQDGCKNAVVVLDFVYA